jgi:GDP-L-fucose synthase
MIKKRKRKILICGATGFIGRNMTEYFAEKKELQVFGTYFNGKPLKNPKIKMIKADLTNKKDVDKAIKGIDIIIQAAATTSGAKEIVEKPYYHVTDNALMNSLIFRSAYENNVSHVIFFSCTVMYQPGNKPVKEIDFDANEEIYPKYFGVGWTKVYLEKMCEFYSRISQTKYTVLRHSNVYGPYDKFDLEKGHVLGATIEKVFKAKDNKITVWGTGKEKRDLLYISDLINCVDLAIKKQKNKFELYNVGLGKAVSVSELVKKIINASGLSIKIEYDKSKPTIKTKLCLNSTKIKNSLGWSPKISLDNGIKKTIDWYKLNRLC